MQFSTPDSRTIASFPMPVFLGLQRIFPERIGTALDRAAPIYGAATIPKNAVKVLFFAKA